MWRFARNLDTEEQMNSSQLLKAHGEKLFNAIDMAVNSLDDLNTLVPVLIQLGYSHSSLGVKEEHFQVSHFCGKFVHESQNLSGFKVKNYVVVCYTLQFFQNLVNLYDYH